MKILALDSSSQTACAAITEDAHVVSEFFMDVGLKHSQTLAPMVDSLLRISGVDAADIDLFVATNGPGSFTGLRIAMATIKGMSFALDKPCVGVSTLYALAKGVDEDGIICACMDARRNEFYNALFKSEGGALKRLTSDRAISLDDLIVCVESIKENIKLVGDGAVICYNKILENSYLKNLYLGKEKNLSVKASAVADAGLELYRENKATTAENLEVNYLRVSQAERLFKENAIKV